MIMIRSALSFATPYMYVYISWYFGVGVSHTGLSQTVNAHFSLLQVFNFQYVCSRHRILMQAGLCNRKTLLLHFFLQLVVAFICGSTLKLSLSL